MLELLNQIPSFVQVILVVILILTAVYIIIALIDAIEGRRMTRERDCHEQQKLYDTMLRIARVCERIGDILATTELLSTVEVTEERVVPYG